MSSGLMRSDGAPKSLSWKRWSVRCSTGALAQPATNASEETASTKEKKVFGTPINADAKICARITLPRITSHQQILLLDVRRRHALDHHVHHRGQAGGHRALH